MRLRFFSLSLTKFERDAGGEYLGERNQNRSSHLYGAGETPNTVRPSGDSESLVGWEKSPDDCWRLRGGKEGGKKKSAHRTSGFSLSIQKLLLELVGQTTLLGENSKWEKANSKIRRPLREGHVSEKDVPGKEGGCGLGVLRSNHWGVVRSGLNKFAAQRKQKLGNGGGGKGKKFGGDLTWGSPPKSKKDKRGSPKVMTSGFPKSEFGCFLRLAKGFSGGR